MNEFSIRIIVFSKKKKKERERKKEKKKKIHETEAVFMPSTFCKKYLFISYEKMQFLCGTALLSARPTLQTLIGFEKNKVII